MRIYCPLFLFFLTAFACGAQQSTRLPKVIVQDSALSEPTPLESADITRITAKDIEQQQSVTLADVLRRVLGAYVTQGGGVGQESRVSLRGTGGANTTVIVNGMPINDGGAFDEAFNLSRWTLDDVSEIQIIRGPMGSLYGPSGIGGVILIETKKGEGAHKNFAKAEGGSFHTYSQTVGIQGQKDFVDYYVNGSRIQSAGAPTTPKPFLPQIQGKSDNPLHQENLTARIGAGSESAHVSFVSRYLSRRLGFRRVPTDLNPFRQNYGESFNRLQGHFDTASGRWHHDLGLGYYQNDLTNTSLSERIVRNASQAQVDWRQGYDITNQLQLQIATDYALEKLYWQKVLIKNTDFKTSHGGVGGTLSYRAFENLTVTGSSRIDKYQGIPTATTYRLGGQYFLEKVIVKGSVGTAFKAPTLQQRFYKDPFWSGNPNLKPERSLGWDLGLERPFLKDRLTVGMTVFQNRIRNLIQNKIGTGLINIGKTRTQGAEGFIRFDPSSSWTLELAHTYTRAWDEKTTIGLIGNPRNKTTFTVIGQMTSQWQVSGNILYIGSRDTLDAVSFDRVKTPSYTIVGAQTSYQLDDHWQVYGRGENLLNRHYQNPQNLQQPGFGIYVGIRARC